MESINLTSNRVIRNLVLLFDFFIMVVVMMVVIKYFGDRVVRPNVLLLAGSFAMLVGQMCFSTIVHQHYATIDRILARTTALCSTYAAVLYVLCMLSKWTYGQVATGKSITLIVISTYVVIVIVRLLESLGIKLLRKYGRNTRHITFVGKEDRLIDIVGDINSNATTGLRFVGYYSPFPSEKLSRMMPYLGDYDKLDSDIERSGRSSDEVYCALPASEKELSKKLIRHCMRQATHFYYVPTFISDLGGYLRPSMIGEQVVFANFTEPLLDPKNRFQKRVFDVVFSGLALLILLPFFPIIALIIKCCSPGPIFFKQARTGVGDKDFMMLKFRSMHVNADADRLQATKDDPRKYPFGDFMRRTSIDELPQLWNIFVGDMSIVGPRPHMRKHTEEYRHLIDDYMLRHYIRPGLTGWAQTTGFRGETSELWQMEGRVKRDIWYVQNWTFWLDIRIIFRTIGQVIMKDKQAY